MRVLVTGGAGYLGSHTVLELIKHGHEPVVVDNFVTSSRNSLARITAYTGIPIVTHEIDARDTAALTTILRETPCEATIHFAGLKAVGESVAEPLRYYENNVSSTLSVIDAVLATGSSSRPPRIIFSSSATVYGEPQWLPFTEDHPVGQGIASPYGMTKFMGERFLSDVATSNSSFQAIALRYFNPIGAHPSGIIGESPLDVPNNLAPYILKVATGELETVGIFGDDYETFDGTGVRDYIHVMDLAAGHVAALGYTKPGFHAINLGTGRGTSVRELIAAFESAVGRQIPTTVLPRRSGDIAEFYSSTELATNLLGWRAERSIEEACEHSWLWQNLNLRSEQSTQFGN